jgi:hypothetical protein
MASFQGNNADNPTQPEYGKKWKEDNNFGCCTSCQKPDQHICTTITSTYTRGDRSAARVSTVDNINNCPCQQSAPVAGPCSGDVHADNDCAGC